jgi:hypothetical protein
MNLDTFMHDMAMIMFMNEFTYEYAYEQEHEML